MTALLDEDIAAALRRRAPAPALWDMTPDQARRASHHRTSAAGGTLAVRSVRNLTIALPDREIPARLYRSGRCRRGPTVVFFHGGGFVTGSIDTHDRQARMLARATGVPVLSVGYRLAPECPFPAAHLDAVDSIVWAATVLAARHGLDGRVAVAGSSAGANLAATAAEVLAGSAHAPVAQLLVYPLLSATGAALPDDPERFIGLTPRALRWYLGHYLPVRADRVDHRFTLFASPVRWAPPAVISAAGLDPLHQDAVRYARALTDTGITVEFLDNPRLNHAFWGMADRSARARAASELMCGRFADLLHSLS